jgi:hypothetical protein
VTCLEVRDRLTEHALGVLPRTDAREVERHLERCAGCRKESSELVEGAATMALSLPSALAPASLEDQILDRFRHASRQAPHPTHGRLRVLAAAALAAALLALGATGWGIAENRHAQTLQAAVNEKVRQVHSLAEAIASFKGSGKTLQASLLPRRGGQGRGSAAIFSAPGANDIVFVDIVLPQSATGPFVVQLVDGEKAINVGRLQKTVEGDWLMYSFSAQDLSHAVSVTVLDRSGGLVLTGTVEPYAGP